MKFGCTLIAVTDMEKSKRFYKDVLGLEVTSDFGANVLLGENIALQTVETWTDFIGGKRVTLSGNSFEIYFEEDDFSSFVQKLSNINDIEYVHRPLEHSWGQRVVRFFDPDHHIIEVGERIKIVVKRFLDSGLSNEDTAKRMDVPVDYILDLLKE